jgi:hypothetical protein
LWKDGATDRVGLSADTVTVSATVMAPQPSRAVASLEALVPELAGAAGASVTVRDAGTADLGLETSRGVTYRNDGGSRRRSL